MVLPKVVIVGAGPGGISCAKALKGAADVTVIETKGWHEINWGTPRALTDPEFTKAVVHPYTAIPDIGTLVAGRVVGVTADAVRLESGEQVTYDYLVLAPGSLYPDPAIKAFSGTLDERKAVLQEEYERLKAASSVAIIGGGPVGVELAGEILTDLPGKQVTIVTNAPQLLEGKSSKVAAAAADWIKKKGGKVVLNQKATKQSDGNWLLADGSPLAADVVYVCLGGKPNTQFLQNLDGVLDERGAIKVNDRLQVQGLSNAFAVGDATDVKETKLGYLAGAQGQLAAQNIKAAASGKPLKTWKPNGGFPAMVVTLGRHSGTGHIGPVNLTGCFSFLPTWMKSRDMFTGKTQKDLGIVAAA